MQCLLKCQATSCTTLLCTVSTMHFLLFTYVLIGSHTYLFSETNPYLYNYIIAGPNLFFKELYYKINLISDTADECPLFIVIWISLYYLLFSQMLYLEIKYKLISLNHKFLNEIKLNWNASMWFGVYICYTSLINLCCCIWNFMGLVLVIFSNFGCRLWYPVVDVLWLM